LRRYSKNGKVTRRKSGEGLLEVEEEEEAGLPGKKRGRKGKEKDAKGASGSGGGGEETRGRAAELAQVLMHGARGVMCSAALQEKGKAGGSLRTSTRPAFEYPHPPPPRVCTSCHPDGT